MAIEDAPTFSNLEAAIQALEWIHLSFGSEAAVGEAFEYLTGQMVPTREDQVLNYAGGYVFQVSDENRVRRLLILGTTSPTYYASQEQIQADAIDDLIRLIRDGKGHIILREIYAINRDNRAPKRDPSIYALALCARYKTRDWQKPADDEEQPTKSQTEFDKYLAALQKASMRLVPLVCRIPTDLFTFLKYAEEISRKYQEHSGWGRMMRRSVEEWYFAREPSRLALQLTKYRNRSGYTHRDVLRLCHANPKSSHAPKGQAAFYDYLFHYAVKGTLDADRLEDDYPEAQVDELRESDVRKFMEAVARVGAMKAESDEAECAKAIREFGLVREHIPTDLLNSATVWEALLERMPMTAMLRNLSKMSTLGLITGEKPENERWVRKVVEDVTDEQKLKAAGIHPLAVLLAKSVYGAGHGMRGKLEFKTNAVVLDALERAFLLAFKNVQPTGKRFCIALDVSGSMSQQLSGTLLPCYDAEIAMSMVALRTEPHAEVVAFTDGLTHMSAINADTTFKEFRDAIYGLNFSSTDCSLPMTWAREQKKQFDVFVIYTDNETYYGDTHPYEALRKYREESGIKDARLVVVAFTATKFTIADPKDPLMLDVCGFDSSTPELIANFVNGKI